MLLHCVQFLWKAKEMVHLATANPLCCSWTGRRERLIISSPLMLTFALTVIIITCGRAQSSMKITFQDLIPKQRIVTHVTYDDDFLESQE